MSSVTIEGTLMPAAGVLKRGERATVAYTDRIKRLVERGYIRIVEVHSKGSEAAAAHAASASELELPFEGDDESEAVKEPPRNASTETWQQFLTEQGIEYPESAGRDDLIAGWVHISQQRAGGS